MSLSKYAHSNKIFDWIYIFFAGLTVIGAYIDGWAHNHLEESLETFFTPWHAIFYTGIFLTGLSLFIFFLINRSKGFTWRFALPKEYFYSLAGAILMLLGGAGDLVWHETFGIETGMEALFSPTHLMLAVGAAFMVSGPLMAVWFRTKARAVHTVHTILSTVYFMSIITFMLQFLHPFSYPWMAESFVILNPVSFDVGSSLGMGGILVYTVILMGIILSTFRHWLFPIGSFTAILTLNATLMTFMTGEYYQFIVTGFVSGVLIDALYWLLIKRYGKMVHVHLFSFFAPFILTAVYVWTVSVSDTMAWAIHTWSGAIMMAGIVGYLVSYMVIPSEK